MEDIKNTQWLRNRNTFGRKERSNLLSKRKKEREIVKYLYYSKVSFIFKQYSSFRDVAKEGMGLIDCLHSRAENPPEDYVSLIPRKNYCSEAVCNEF